MKSRLAGKWTVTITALLSLGLVAILISSCGGGTEDSTQPPGDSLKYPPGTTDEMLTETTGSGGPALQEEEQRPEDERNEPPPETAAPDASAELAGARFAVVEATRRDSNADVLTSGQREVAGDYLEIELVVENVGDDLVDLSEYSFRIWSPGIEADEYEEYYGMNGTFGKYVSENMISAVLLDYTTLQPAAYKLKMGESADGVFLFYDLNPKRTSLNEGVTKEGTNLVFYKSRGEDAGEEIEINLAGYPG